MKKFSLILIPLIILFFSFENKEADRFEIVKNLDIFSDLFKQVNNLYVDETLPGELIKNGIDGMLNGLDPYTTFYPESEIEDYKIMTTGQYGGIGARIKNMNKMSIIDEIFEGSPAMKAGLKTGDQIIEVDGTIITEKLAQDMSKLLKGTPGTEVKIKIQRQGVNEALTFQFKREEIKLSSVPYYGMLNNETGYIKMTSFTKDVNQEIKEAFLDLKNNKNMKKLVFDLRGNPGGLLFESINIVNFFTPKEEKVVETRGRLKEWTKTYKNINQPIDLEIPIVVLVDEGSASASEIVSGSLQDMDRAVIMGKNTFGKGLVQTTVKLKYNTSMKITTAKYYIPSGRCIQEIDYSDKESKGKGKKTPDSTYVNFKTKSGRIVKDGHGIQPDVFIEPLKTSQAVSAIQKENHVFNFVTEYLAKHPINQELSELEVNDEIFNDFINYMKIKQLTYQSNTENKITELETSALNDNLLDYIGSDLSIIKNKINENKINELIKNKEEIKKIIRDEIVLRLFYQKGKIQKNINDDLYVKEALALLADQTKWNKILGK